MSDLLASECFGYRKEDQLLASLNQLTRYHLEGCAPYAKLYPDWRPAGSLEDLPFLHVGLFKRLVLKTEASGLLHQRTLTSSSTAGAAPSQIVLDQRSSALQTKSTAAIHRAWLGETPRPLLILDEAKALRQRGRLTARLAAALSLQSLASETHFILADVQRPESVRWDLVRDVAKRNERLMLYGPTWGLWKSWAEILAPADVKGLLRTKTIDYVHSGGWKKLEEIKVNRRQFDATLIKKASPNSQVVDYYGLSEQVGILFPLCRLGRRHAPVWSEVLVRDIYTLEPIIGRPGFLQLMNPLAWGAPYHSVLTEDIGLRSSGDCPCGRAGRHFELIGRVPRAEIRGCANV